MRKSVVISGVIGFLAIIGFIILLMCITKIPQGHVGVVYSVNGVKEETKSPGWHLTAPFDKVNKYPTKTQTHKYKDLNVATSDGKNIKLDIDVSYKVDATKAVNLFNRFGSADIEELEKGYLRSRVQDNVRQAISKYSVIDAFGVKTGEIKQDTLNKLNDNLEKQGFIIDDIALSSPTADKNTQKAIDERVKANQELERTKVDKQIAEENAKKKEIEAKGEKKANDIRSESLTEEVLQQQLIEKWNGKQPISIGSDSVITNLNK
ncbi:putative membrane protein [Staphylococcus phage vB_SauM_LM12]|nr:putative membrane protein [Staphylococcus phage vB_SauM_LM12]